jgi:hypothetical protein
VKDGPTLGFVDASELSWKPGLWPATYQAEVGPKKLTLAKGEHFWNRSAELMGVQYVGSMSADALQVVLTVYND